MIDYTQWIASQEWPATEGEIPQFYPITIEVPSEEDPEAVDSVAVVRGHIAVPGLTAQQCFLAAMVYASENFNTEAEEGFEKIDFKKHTFTLLLKTTQGDKNTETTYTRSITFKATDGGLDFEAAQIDCRYREKGLIPRTLRMEKLHPDTNRRHAELVKEFSEVNSAYLDGMKQYTSTRKDIQSPNYAKLAKGAKVEVGMNMDEVTILAGAPVNKRKSGERYRWIYSNDYVIIFTDGVVSKIVQ